NTDLTFMQFITNLAPIIIIIMLLTALFFAIFYRKSLRTTPELKAELMTLDEHSEITDLPLLRKSLVVLALTIVGFFIHQTIHLESATVALAGAFLLLLLTNERFLEKSLERVEWTTIFFFLGLFVLVSGLVETGVIAKLAERAIDLTGGNLTAASLMILWLSAIASAFIDNIPFVATMIPLIQEMGQRGITDLNPLWWSLSIGACLGGNGTLVGASANLIVAGLAAKEGHPITFLGYLKIGFPLMVASVVISTVYVYLRYLI
ncbi:MAG: anion permease, partial [Gorillibacterium sp.]|nr:anion permease [Gorillibacterium sp.]